MDSFVNMETDEQDSSSLGQIPVTSSGNQFSGNTQNDLTEGASNSASIQISPLNSNPSSDQQYNQMIYHQQSEHNQINSAEFTVYNPFPQTHSSNQQPQFTTLSSMDTTTGSKFQPDQSNVQQLQQTQHYVPQSDTNFPVGTSQQFRSTPITWVPLPEVDTLVNRSTNANFNNNFTVNNSFSGGSYTSNTQSAHPYGRPVNKSSTIMDQMTSLLKQGAIQSDDGEDEEEEDEDDQSDDQPTPKSSKGKKGGGKNTPRKRVGSVNKNQSSSVINAKNTRDRRRECFEVNENYMMRCSAVTYVKIIKGITSEWKKYKTMTNNLTLTVKQHEQRIQQLMEQNQQLSQQLSRLYNNQSQQFFQLQRQINQFQQQFSQQQQQQQQQIYSNNENSPLSSTNNVFSNQFQQKQHQDSQNDDQLIDPALDQITDYLAIMTTEELGKNTSQL